MTVLLVVGNVNLVGSGLCATLRRYALGGRLLLTDHCLKLQLTKLHVSANAKEARCTLHQ